MIRPLNRNIIVKPTDWKDVNQDGLITTTTTSEMPSFGLLLSMAEDCKTKIRIGDTVYYSKYAGSKLKFNNDEFLVLNEEDLLGVKE